MNEKSIWRVSAWISVALVTLVYVALLGIDVPREMIRNGGAWMYRVGYVIGMMVGFFIPVWLAKVIYNRIPKQ